MCVGGGVTAYMYHPSIIALWFAFDVCPSDVCCLLACLQHVSIKGYFVLLFSLFSWLVISFA